jgi:hypothetical protein
MMIATRMLCLALAATSLLLASCGKSSAPAPASAPPSAGAVAPLVAAEKPLPVVKGLPGDIPDTQVFITFRSASGGYSVEAPEGWARTENGSNVKFTDHFDGERVGVSASAAAPTVDSARANQVPAIFATGRAVTIEVVKSATLSNRTPVIEIAYSSNSAPDAVTGKQVRLSDLTYLYYSRGKVAALTLWAPNGTDNVDQWKRISESFRWQ